MRKILYISGTRADYGLMRNTLKHIRNKKGLQLKIIATGMHLMEDFGKTVSEIRRDGFDVSTIDATYLGDDRESMAAFVGKLIIKLTIEMQKNRPDMILLLGDRGEMLAAAIVGTYLSIPIAHLHGGEISGNVDDRVRHAITKLAHIHLPATEKSAKRIKAMGEESWRIHVVGAPGLEEIIGRKQPPKKEVFSKFSLDEKKPIIVVIQHPVTTEIEDAGRQMKTTLEAVSAFDANRVVIYPNADAGGRKMIKFIEEYSKRPGFTVYKSIEHSDFLTLLKYADVLVGNSSCGLIEAPSFHLPAVNIGTRQTGRERAKNVIDVGYSKGNIIKAIRLTISKEFRKKIRKCKNPYGDGKTAKKVVNVLMGLRLDDRLIQKCRF